MKIRNITLRKLKFCKKREWVNEKIGCMFVSIVKVKRGHLPESKLFDLWQMRPKLKKWNKVQGLDKQEHNSRLSFENYMF